MIIILAITWIIYSSVEGFTQAFYYDLFPSEKKHINLHPYFMIQRFIVSTLMSYLVYEVGDLVNSIIFSLALALMFSFFHNGFYYLTRKKLSKTITMYPKGFWDHSETSTAIIELGTKFRIGMFVMGIVFLIGVIMDINEMVNPY